MDLTSRLEKLYAGAVYDVLNEMGYRDCVLPPGITALKEGQRLCGTDETCADYDAIIIRRHVRCALMIRRRR